MVKTWKFTKKNFFFKTDFKEHTFFIREYNHCVYKFLSYNMTVIMPTFSLSYYNRRNTEIVSWFTVGKPTFQ